MNGKELNEMEKLKLIERGIDPESGTRLKISSDGAGKSAPQVYCTRWGAKVPIATIFSNAERI